MLEERAAAEENLIDFVKGGWRNIDPSPYVHGWHLEAIAEHLEAVTRGQIKRLVINVPPRTSKSSIVSIAWPAWTWAQKPRRNEEGDILDEDYLAGPHAQFLFSSYAQTLSVRDSVKTRRLIMSPWYQRLFGDRYQLTGDQNAKVRFETNKGGVRLATSVDGSLTGEGGSIVVVDDPHNAVEMESELVRQGTLEWWDASMSTRLNNQKLGAMVVIMQRLHEEDLTGHILASDTSHEWVHLCLPMRYEPERHCHTVIGWEDPREVEGELLCPERFGDAEVRRLEMNLGPFQAAGQLQQRPSPKGGGIFPREQWKLWGNPEDPEDPVFKKFPRMEYIVGSLDGAYTEKQENDWSAYTIWGIYSDRHGVSHAILMKAWRARLPIHELVEKVHQTSKFFKVDRVLIENKATGISVNQELLRLHSNEGYSVQLCDPKGQDKVARAYSVQALLFAGLIWAPDRGYADLVIDEMASFPKGKHDDLVDSSVQALKFFRTSGLLKMPEERQAEVEDEAAHKPKSRPLYPV